MDSLFCMYLMMTPSMGGLSDTFKALTLFLRLETSPSHKLCGRIYDKRLTKSKKLNAFVACELSKSFYEVNQWWVYTGVAEKDVMHKTRLLDYYTCVLSPLHV